MATLAQHIFRAGQRRTARDTIAIQTVLWRRSPPFGDPVDATVINISRYGFMARTALNAIDGSLIAIDLPEVGEIRARAVWSMEDSVGGEFLLPISSSAYAAMLAYLCEKPAET